MSDCYSSVHHIAAGDSLSAKGFRCDSVGGKEHKHKACRTSLKGTASKSHSQASIPYKKPSNENKIPRMNTSQDTAIEDDGRISSSSRGPLPSEAFRSTFIHDRDSDTASGFLVRGTNKSFSARTSEITSHGSKFSAHPPGSVASERRPLPPASRKAELSGTRSRSSCLATESSSASENDIKGASHVRSEWMTIRGDFDPPSIPSRPTTSRACSQCLAPKAEKQARCETATPTLSEFSATQVRRCEGCWGECHECRQSQPWSEHTLSPSQSWRCDRGLDYCGCCNFCVHRPGRPYIQGVGCEEERWYEEQKAFDDAFAGRGPWPIVGGWDDGSRDRLRGLDERLVRGDRKSRQASQGRLSAADTQTKIPADVDYTQCRPVEPNGYIRNFKDYPDAMDSRTKILDEISQANVENRLRQLEHEILAHPGRLENSATASTSIRRHDQSITRADLDLRDLAKQVLEMNLQQKMQREHMVLARLEKIEEKIMSKQSALMAQHTAQSQIKEILELQQLLVQQRNELSKLRQHVAILPELRANVANLHEEVIWTMDQINIVENLARQQKRTGQTDIKDQGGYANRGHSELTGHASVTPPDYRTSSLSRAQKIVTPGFEQEFGDEWGQPIPANKNHGTPPIASSASRNGWNKVPQTVTQSIPSFPSHGWGQRSGAFDGGWGRQPSSLNDSDRTDAPMPFKGRRWGIVGNSWGDGGDSTFWGRSMDTFDRTRRAAHIGWGSPDGQYDETLSMRSASQPVGLARSDMWKSGHVGLINLDAENTSRIGSQHRCPTVETISDADLVSRPSSIDRDWNHINSYRGRNEIVPFLPSRIVHSSLQRSNSWGDMSSVNHPPRPTKSKPHRCEISSFSSDGYRYERDGWMRIQGTSPASWSQVDGQGWGEDRWDGRGGACGDWRSGLNG